MTAPRRVHLGVQYNAEDPHEIWHREHLPSINSTESFVQAAEIAERALFDFFFQAETSAVPEGPEGIRAPYVVGRVDNITAQAFLASRFRSLGFVSTINTSNNNPFDIARRFHSLEQVAPGRTGWNLVLGGNRTAFRNYRTIGDRDSIDRYRHGEEVLALVRAYLGSDAAVQRTGDYFDVAAHRLRSSRPTSEPFVFYAGDSPSSRDFAVAHADAIYTHYGSLEHGQPFYRDIHARLAAVGRPASEFKIFARVAVVVGETDAHAEELQRELLPHQVHLSTVQKLVDAVWGDGFADFDPDGPFPSTDPPNGAVVAAVGSSMGLYLKGDAQRAAQQLRAVQRRTGYGARRVLVLASGTDLIVGGPSSVARRLTELVAERAVDGFVIVPHIAGIWLDRFADLVIPELQTAGVYPERYAEGSLRDRVSSDRLD